MTADLSDESLLFQTVHDVTVVLFSRLLSTDFLQHNCSTHGEKDLSFGRQFLCFTFAFMIRAFASETSKQMIRLNPFRFLGEKRCSSICPKKSTENSIQMVSAPCFTSNKSVYLADKLIKFQNKDSVSSNFRTISEAYIGMNQS